ncbi:6-phosphogluconolactonase [Pseudomaricurvus sp. HS19]|uniref:6-phosphogluconolactonase n=1 Tax=Pseudomaricurvus sp. HS19 TaxID=2692626 RepID=UPI0013712FB8|nr:6-phosphogluconolactonase [Pseudomaricurvus sp. HS19]MYM61760.1 6-phosphogluconolactonase [Pseudomaricurvus sp. HS19]
MIREHRFSDREALTQALLESVVATLREDLQQQGGASLLASGGSTPGPLYRLLSEVELPWEQVQVALVDERWVAPDHDASNERLLRQTLLQNRAATANFIAMKNGSATPADGVAACNRAYRALQMPATVCLLGMGPDAHTASLFPGAEGLAEAFASAGPCAAIEAQRSAVTGEYTSRMTMTPQALLQSRLLVLLITGEDKWQVYRQALEAADPLLSPVSLFLQQAASLEVYWAP